MSSSILVEERRPAVRLELRLIVTHHVFFHHRTRMFMADTHIIKNECLEQAKVMRQRLCLKVSIVSRREKILDFI
jgi:hypothetical protein